MHKTIITTALTLFTWSNSYSQDGQVTIEQDPLVEQLLQKRKQLLKTGELKNYYSIQVISGDINTARKTLTNCKTKFTDYKSDIVYQTPHYKVWIGKYRNRLEADAALLQITKEYPGAFVFEPENKKITTKKPSN